MTFNPRWLALWAIPALIGLLTAALAGGLLLWVFSIMVTVTSLILGVLYATSDPWYPGQHGADKGGPEQ